MKVIFLDIDGVLNNWADDNLTDDQWYNPEYMVQLKELVNNTGAKIVLISTWRHHWSLVDKVKTELSKYNMELFDLTSKLTHYKPIAIKHYLDTHKDICGYVVLDDDDYRNFFHDRQVRTVSDGRMGLDQSFRLEAEKILNKT